MNKIIVPTDFSPNALKALNYAAEIAKASGAAICIVHVMDISSAVMNDTIIIQGNLDDELVAGNKKRLSTLVASTREITGRPVEEKLITGLLTDGIIEAAREVRADLIVMGTLGDAAIQEKIFGSVTAKIIGKSLIPVLAVPLMYTWEPPKNVLLAIQDFSEAPAVLTPLIKFSQVFNAVVKVTIFTNEKNAQAVDFLQHKRDVELFCNNMRHEHPELKIEAQPIYGVHFEEAIKTFIHENDTSLLAMLNHKRNFLESIFHRSMTKKMSYHTDIPLLSLPVE